MNASSLAFVNAPPRSFTAARRRQSAFTLVEVVLAIGVVAFAFVGMFALLPAGLGVFREAMDTSISAQIAQRIVSEATQSDFDSLVPEGGNAVAGVTKGGSAGQFYALPLRYFDDQGTELGVADSTTLIPTLTESEKQRVLYTARVRGSLPGAANPATQDQDAFASLPASENEPRFSPRFVTFLTIQVVKNPNRPVLDSLIDPTSFLIAPRLAGNIHLPLKTFPAVVARNAYRNAE